MEFLSTAFFVVFSTVGAVFVHLLAEELSERSHPIAKALLAIAVRQLPASERERYQEEWFAHLSDCPGPLSKMGHALQCALCAHSLRMTLAGREVTDRSPTVELTINKRLFKTDVHTGLFLCGGMLKVLSADTKKSDYIDELEQLIAHLVDKGGNPENANREDVLRFRNMIDSLLEDFSNSVTPES